MVRALLLSLTLGLTALLPFTLPVATKLIKACRTNVDGQGHCAIIATLTSQHR